MHSFSARAVLKPLSLTLAMTLGSAALANEDEVKKSMEAFIGAPAVESVKRTEFGGLYEVVLKNDSSSTPMRRTASSSTAMSSTPQPVAT